MRVTALLLIIAVLALAAITCTSQRQYQPLCHVLFFECRGLTGEL